MALRAVFSFLTLWGITRWLGKKQVGQLTFFDYISGITFGALASQIINDERRWPRPFLGLLIWAALAQLFHYLDLKGRKLHRILDDAPAVLIRNGELVEQNLQKLRINVEELMSMLRQEGHFHLESVEFAILEANGKLSVMPRSQYRPLQPRDLGLATPYEGLMIQVMQEGRPIAHGLHQAGLDEAWLQGELAKQQVEPGQVFAAWLDTQGRLLIQRYHPT